MRYVNSLRSRKLGMLAVVQGHRAVGAPKGESVRRVEGWILGRAPAPRFLD